MFHLQNELEPVGAFKALSPWQVANNLSGGRILEDNIVIFYLDLRKIAHLRVLEEEVEVDRVLARNGDKLIGEPDLGQTYQ